jgi:Uma2 family endonuclease
MSASATTAPAPAPASVPVSVPESVGPKKRWTTAEFDRLVADGYLRDGPDTYLWDFEIIEPMSEYPPHVHALANLYRLLILRLPEDAWTVSQNAPLELRDGYKPQPDLSVVRGPRGRYDGRTFVPADVALLVEVSNTSYPKDSVPFLREYASAGVPQYWIVNIPERRVEVYRLPSRPGVGLPGYLSRDDYGLGSSLPLSLDGDGGAETFGAVPVAAVLRNSLGPGERA